MYQYMRKLRHLETISISSSNLKLNNYNYGQNSYILSHFKASKSGMCVGPHLGLVFLFKLGTRTIHPSCGIVHEYGCMSFSTHNQTEMHRNVLLLINQHFLTELVNLLIGLQCMQ